MNQLISVISGPVFGGAHNQALQLNDPLAAAGWNTTVVLPTDEGDAYARLSDAGVAVVRIPMQRLRISRSPSAFLGFAADVVPQVRRLKRVMEDLRPSVVQVHGPVHPQPALAARVLEVPVVWQLLDTRAPMIVRRSAMPAITRLADVIMSTGMQVAQSYPGATSVRDRLVTYVPPVDVELFASRAPFGARAREILDVSPSTPLIGAVGNLNPQKGYEQLLDCAQRVRRVVPEVELRIVGADSTAHPGYRDRLDECARSRGFDPGRVFRSAPPPLEICDVMPAFDVLAVSSVPLSEGIPTVIIEAQAAGLPVVSTDVGSVREVITDGTNGLVVAPNDPSALAAAILTVLQQPERAAGMSRAGQERACREWTLDRCTQAHLFAYRSALRRRPPRVARSYRAPNASSHAASTVLDASRGE
jgi:glycosyltransferase involved in cell wall biosynthesis